MAMRSAWMGVCVTGLLSSAFGQISGPVEPVGETAQERGWTTEEVTRGLMNPWSIVWLPDSESALVTERSGQIRVVQNGLLRMEPVAGVPEVFASGQGGLLDIVLHPEFATNRRIYFSASTGTNRANRTTLFRAVIDDELSALSDVEELFRNNTDKPGSQHFGSRLLWLKDGSLLMSLGDGGNPPIRLDGRYIRENAQDLSSHLGKVLRMDEDGQPMQDNPFARDDDPETDAYIYTYGHRNIQGLVIRPGTDEVWVTEHGARGGDELNLLIAGANYGWPLVTYSREYSGPRITEATTMEGARDPEVVWTPCIAPSGLAFYTGNDFPEWRGDMLAGGLVLRQVRRLDFEGEEIVGQTTLQFDDRIRWVGMGPDQQLYVLTDELDGGLFRIVPSEE